MVKKNIKQIESIKPPTFKHEDTMRFEMIDRMMRDNKGVWIESQ